MIRDLGKGGLTTTEIPNQVRDDAVFFLDGKKYSCGKLFIDDSENVSQIEMLQTGEIKSLILLKYFASFAACPLFGAVASDLGLS